MYTQNVPNENLSKLTRRAMEKYGPETCLKAYYENNAIGNGAGTIGGYGRGSVSRGNAMIDAGREMVTGSR